MFMISPPGKDKEPAVGGSNVGGGNIGGHIESESDAPNTVTRIAERGETTDRKKMENEELKVM